MSDLIEADNIEKEFYKQIQDKKIEIKTPQDIERIDVLFNDSLKSMINIIKDGSYDEEEGLIIKSRFIIDFHVRLAEKYGFNPYDIASYFGSHNVNMFEQAVKDIKKFT
jgi:ERCC4-related helicase